ncbi:MAG: LuxR C-terminal-related transcriptional regulator [Thermoanaerobaculales bacterium]|jgi:DNA-binding CsgD family transcriptional regulator|nr:LuxR C-terminal-related transcriptional regulator [Thermoanaerobaculales bacterium]
MGDARSTSPPVDAVAAKDLGLGQVVELFCLAAGVAWAEFSITSRKSGERNVFVTGSPVDDAATLALEIDDETTARLSLAATDRPSSRVVDLLTAALRRELERHRLRAESALFQRAANSSAASILIFSRSGNILFANDLADELISRQTEEELTVRWKDAQPQPLFQRLILEVADFLSQQSRENGEDLLVLSDGSELSCELSALPAGDCTDVRSAMVVLREVVPSPARQVRDFAKLNKLSPREHEVLRLLVRGYDTAGLAEQLSISPHTVRDHLKNVYRKTSTRSRSELLRAISGASS